jgi:ATP-dependent Clp protease ATP-binding subunit ClpA
MSGEADSRTEQLVRAVDAAAPGDDTLAKLQTAVSTAADVTHSADALVEHYVALARSAGHSWTVIGDQLGVTKQAARQRFSRLVLDDAVGDAADAMVVAERLATCLDAAAAAADGEDSVIGTQHLLLGLLSVGYAATVLDQLGVTRDKVREACSRLFEPVTGAEGRRIVGDGDAESALVQAKRLAARRGQSQVRTEHLLFVLALDCGAAARRVLNDLGVDPARVKKELADTLPPPPRRRRIGRAGGRTRACSFCGCTDTGRPMVAGPGVWICGECVQISVEVLASSRRGLRAD